MTDSPESILVRLDDRLGELNSSYVKLEVTTRTEMSGLREDFMDMRELLREITRAQANLSERQTLTEAQTATMQDDRVGQAKLDTRLSVLEERVQNNAPQKFAWPTVATALVAIGSLLWSLFGK